MASTKLINQAKWIWIPEYDDTTDPGKFVLFRKSFELASIPEGPQLLRVSADTRYRMLVNGVRASFGPCKSYLARWYFEEVDIAPFLHPGKNVISIRVLRFSFAHAGNSSMIRANIPGLIVQGQIGDFSLNSDPSWRSVEDKSVALIPRSEWNFALGPPFLSLNERCDLRNAEPKWTSPDFDDGHWTAAIYHSARSPMLPSLEPRRLTERPIPNLTEIDGNFHSAVQTKGSSSPADWNDFLQGRPIEIPTNTTETVEWRSEVLTTAFLRVVCEAGGGSKLIITCAESYERKHEKAGSIGAIRWKGDRADNISGHLYGPDDEITLAKGHNVYEPFWFRTFRYVRLSIHAVGQPLILKSFTFRETHYPLEINTSISDFKGFEDMWKISLNTLRNCMHETFEDCPYYEQNQFAMDTRAMMLFNYTLSRDDRLARKSIQEFYASRRDDGLVETHFPLPFRGINIPQFSLYWILMICDHYRYFGDKALVRRYIGAVDDMLNHFLVRREDRGLVGTFDEESWPYVDWVKEWHGTGGLQTMGIPPCYYQGDGVVTYNSLIVAAVLQQTSRLHTVLGRQCVADEYNNLARSLVSAVNKHCFDGDMYVDGPSTTAKSQHAQIWAILSDAVTGKAATDLMRKTLETPNLPKCSYSMSFYVLRAAQKVGLYEEYFHELMSPWREMIANNLTTWAEDDVMFRSDCHGWSSSPIYEIAHEIFGVQPAADGYEKVVIKPRFGLLERAKGKFVVGKGTVSVEWADGVLNISSDRAVEVEVMAAGETFSRNMAPDKVEKIEYSCMRK